MSDRKRMVAGAKGQESQSLRLLPVISLGIVAGCVLIWSGVLARAVAPSEKVPESLAIPFRELAASSPRIGEHFPPVTLVVFSKFPCVDCDRLGESIASMRRRYPQHTAVVWKVAADSADQEASSAARLWYCRYEHESFITTAELAHAFPYFAGHPGAEQVRVERRVHPEDAPFEACAGSARTRKLLSDASKQAELLGVTYVPLMLLNGEKLTAIPGSSQLNDLVANALRNRKRGV